MRDYFKIFPDLPAFPGQETEEQGRARRTQEERLAAMRAAYTTPEEWGKLPAITRLGRSIMEYPRGLPGYPWAREKVAGLFHWETLRYGYTPGVQERLIYGTAKTYQEMQQRAQATEDARSITNNIIFFALSGHPVEPAFVEQYLFTPSLSEEQQKWLLQFATNTYNATPEELSKIPAPEGTDYDTLMRWGEGENPLLVGSLVAWSKNIEDVEGALREIYAPAGVVGLPEAAALQQDIYRKWLAGNISCKDILAMDAPDDVKRKVMDDLDALAESMGLELGDETIPPADRLEALEDYRFSPSQITDEKERASYGEQRLREMLVLGMKNRTIDVPLPLTDEEGKTLPGILKPDNSVWVGDKQVGTWTGEEFKPSGYAWYKWAGIGLLQALDKVWYPFEIIGASLIRGVLATPLEKIRPVGYAGYVWDGGTLSYEDWIAQGQPELPYPGIETTVENWRKVMPMWSRMLIESIPLVAVPATLPLAAGLRTGRIGIGAFRAGSKAAKAVGYGLELTTLPAQERLTVGAMNVIGFPIKRAAKGVRKLFIVNAERSFNREISNYMVKAGVPRTEARKVGKWYLITRQKELNEVTADVIGKLSLEDLPKEEMQNLSKRAGEEIFERTKLLIAEASAEVKANPKMVDALIDARGALVAKGVKPEDITPELLESLLPEGLKLEILPKVAPKIAPEVVEVPGAELRALYTAPARMKGFKSAARGEALEYLSRLEKLSYVEGIPRTAIMANQAAREARKGNLEAAAALANRVFADMYERYLTAHPKFELVAGEVISPEKMLWTGKWKDAIIPPGLLADLMPPQADMVNALRNLGFSVDPAWVSNNPGKAWIKLLDTVAGKKNLATWGVIDELDRLARKPIPESPVVFWANQFKKQLGDYKPVEEIGATMAAKQAPNQPLQAVWKFEPVEAGADWYRLDMWKVTEAVPLSEETHAFLGNVMNFIREQPGVRPNMEVIIGSKASFSPGKVGFVVLSEDEAVTYLAGKLTSFVRSEDRDTMRMLAKIWGSDKVANAHLLTYRAAEASGYAATDASEIAGSLTKRFFDALPIPAPAPAPEAVVAAAEKVFNPEKEIPLAEQKEAAEVLVRELEQKEGARSGVISGGEARATTSEGVQGAVDREFFTTTCPFDAAAVHCKRNPGDIPGFVELIKEAFVPFKGRTSRGKIPDSALKAKYKDFSNFGLGISMDTDRAMLTIDGGAYGRPLYDTLNSSIRQMVWAKDNVRAMLEGEYAKLLEMAGIDKMYENKAFRSAMFDVVKQIGISADDVAKDVAELMQRPGVSEFMAAGNFSQVEMEGLLSATKVLRAMYDRAWAAGNAIRTAIGRDPIPYRQDYIPEMWKQSRWRRALGLSLKYIRERSPSNDFYRPDAPPDPRVLPKLGRVLTPEKDVDILFHDYVRTITDDAFNGLVISYGKPFVSMLKAKNCPNAARVISDLLNEAYAFQPSWITRACNVVPFYPIIENNLIRLRRRLSGAVFAYNPAWNIFVQSTAHSITLMRTGVENTSKGAIAWITNPALRAKLWENCFSLHAKRQMGGIVYEGTKMDAEVWVRGNLLDKAEYIGNYLTRTIEINATGMACAAGYYDGLAKGMSGRMLWDYASDVGARTQTMYNRESITGILRSPIVGAVLPFQSFPAEMLTTIRETIPIRQFAAGAWRTVAADSITGKALIRNRVKMILEFYAAMYSCNLASASVTGRRPWDTTSFLPFYALVNLGIDQYTFMASWGGGTILPLAYVQEFQRGIRDIIQNDDWDRMRSWTLRYNMMGGVQANRMIDGIIAVLHGGVEDVTGEELYKVKPEEFLKAVLLGPASTEGGKEYYNRMRGADPEIDRIRDDVIATVDKLGKTDEKGYIYTTHDLARDLMELARREDLGESPESVICGEMAFPDLAEFYFHCRQLIDQYEKLPEGERSLWRRQNPFADAILFMFRPGVGAPLTDTGKGYAALLVEKWGISWNAIPGTSAQRREWGTWIDIARKHRIEMEIMFWEEYGRNFPSGGISE